MTVRRIRAGSEMNAKLNRVRGGRFQIGTDSISIDANSGAPSANSGAHRSSMVIFVFVFLIGLMSEASWALPTANSRPQNSATPNSRGDSVIRKVVFIGDSLTAGYGVQKEEAFPAVVERKLRQSGHNVTVTNAGISGSVSAEADRRIKWFLRDPKSKPDIIVLELGGNDGLKGTPVAVIKSNLAKAIDLAQNNQVKVVLAGIKIFSNYGASYTRDFENVFTELAREKKVPLVPFVLEGVALDPNLNLPDGKHPNAKGHERVADVVLKTLEPLL